jgi:putative FmdB family regulatory protein
LTGPHYNGGFVAKAPIMPIYAYRCASCGHAKDVLQKVSDPVLTVCPSCGAETFQKQLTAAGFQLKGSGWYVTDFKGGGGTSAPAKDKPSEGGETKKESTSGGGDAKSGGGTDAKSGDGGGSSSSEGKPAASGGGCGGPCACH